MTKKHVGLILYYLIYTFVYAGWIFHRCDNPLVFRYSRNYVVFLVGMAVLFFLPVLIGRYRRAVGTKGFWFSIIPCLLLGVVLYAVASLVYYHTRVRGFEPFVQVHYYRFKSPPKPKQKDEVRVLCLGGSTTRNFRLPPAQRYPAVLQALLEERYPSKRVTVFNAGMDWYTTKHSLINYVTYYRDWQPDVVVVMHAINDLCRSFAPPEFCLGEYNDRWSHYYGPAINGVKPPTFERHVFGSFLDTWYSMFRFVEADHPVERYRAIRPFENNLRKIVRYTRSDGAEVVLVTQPSLYKPEMNAEESRLLLFGKKFCACPRNPVQKEYPSPQSLRQAENAFNAVVRRVASSGKAVLVDADPSIAKTAANFSDDVHYTRQGARLLAQQVADTIVAQRLAERSGPRTAPSARRPAGRGAQHDAPVAGATEASCVVRASR